MHIMTVVARIVQPAKSTGVFIPDGSIRMGVLRIHRIQNTIHRDGIRVCKFACDVRANRGNGSGNEHRFGVISKISVSGIGREIFGDRSTLDSHKSKT